MDTTKHLYLDTDSNQVKHEKIRDEFFRIYADKESDINEFTWDGPSDWTIWESQRPKILFLGKEARQGAHPCVPNQK